MVHDIVTALALSLAVQAAFFVFAATFKTDKVTDMAYSVTFIVLGVAAFLRSDARDLPSMLLLAMIVVWAVRLGGYLVYRIWQIGRDERFDGIREDFTRFLKFWVLQGVAAWLIIMPVILWFSRPGEATPWMWVGGVVWLVGLVIESVADQQKFAFRQAPSRHGRWTDVGLWRFSRHPNYFGEILCWWGILVFVAPALGAWSLLAAVGPLTITTLLLRVTGIPPLEARARERWGDDPAYRAYRARTRVLVPWPVKPTS